MRYIKNRKRVIVFVALVVFASFATLINANPAFSKVHKIPLGFNLELTGGIASITIPVSYGLLDYIKSINDQGGFEYKCLVDGKMHKAKYDIMWADNGYNVSRSMSNVRRFANRGAKVILSA